MPEEYEDYGFGVWFRAKTGRYHVFVMISGKGPNAQCVNRDFAGMEGTTAFLEGLDLAEQSSSSFGYEVVGPNKYFE